MESHFLYSPGVPAADRERAQQLEVTGERAATEEITFDGATISTRTLTPDGTVVMQSTTPLDEETEVTTFEGRTIKVTLLIEKKNKHPRMTQWFR